jgi:hypothetical protein
MPRSRPFRTSERKSIKTRKVQGSEDRYAKQSVSPGEIDELYADDGSAPESMAAQIEQMRRSNKTTEERSN